MEENKNVEYKISINQLFFKPFYRIHLSTITNNNERLWNEPHL